MVGDSGYKFLVILIIRIEFLLGSSTPLLSNQSEERDFFTFADWRMTASNPVLFQNFGDGWHKNYPFILAGNDFLVKR